METPLGFYTLLVQRVISCKYLRKLLFLLLMGFALSFVCVACSNDDGNGALENDTTDIAVTGLVEAFGCTYANIGGYANLNLLPAGSGKSEIGIEIRGAGSEYDDSDEGITSSLMGNIFTVEFDDLSPSTEYEYRSFVRHGGITHYGDYHTFTTKQAYNVTSTGIASDVTYNSVTITSRVKYSIDERDEIRVGVAYSTRKTALHQDSVFFERICYEVDENKEEFVVTLNMLSDNTAYYYASFTSFNGTYVFSDVKSFKTEEHLTSGILKGHSWIDLGLPSGLKWASCNVGASSPEEYGGYYAWGETEEKSDYSWETYKWCNGSSTSITKYCTDGDYGTVDNKTVLAPEDDVAHVKWGNGWRMPTIEDVKELCNYCSWEWTTYNGVNGQLVTGSNGNSIFLPAAGWRYSGMAEVPGSGGSYWSASLDKSRSYCAYRLDFYDGGSSGKYVNSRNCVLTVRPVTK